MNIQVLFFGATADITGQRRLDIEVPTEIMAHAVLENLVTAYPRLSQHKLHISINQQYPNGEEVICDGDEIAIFTAVSGG